jgi:hypothetical protein
MKMTPARRGARVGLIAVGLAVSVGLAGCLQVAPAAPSTTPSAVATSPGVSTPTTSPTPTVAPTNRAFVENCGILITPDQLYAYNPNYVVDADYASKTGTVAAAVKAQLGQTCGWIDESSGDILEVSVAAPTPSALASAKASASAGTAISAYGERGFFTVKTGIGSAQIFMGSLWLVVSSPDFASSADAESIYPIVVHNQMTAGG